MKFVFTVYPDTENEKLHFCDINTVLSTALRLKLCEMFYFPTFLKWANIHV